MGDNVDVCQFLNIFNLFEIQSSKMGSMYRLSPIISTETMVFDLPTTMYKLPVIQNSNNGESSNQSQELSNDDLNELKQLEKKQEAILSQLEALKIDVAKLPKTAGNQTKAVSGVTDVVIRASPNHAPHTLPIICKKLSKFSQVPTFTLVCQKEFPKSSKIFCQ